MKRHFLAVLVVLAALLLAGCVEIPVADTASGTKTAAPSDPTLTPSAEPTVTTEVPTDSGEPTDITTTESVTTEQPSFTDADGFPNSTGDGETKRY